MLIYRIDDELFLANAAFFVRDVRTRLASSDPPAGTLVIDLEDVSDIDTMASEQLDQLLDDLAATGVEVSLALVRQTVRICWNTPGRSIGSERIEYPWRSMAPSVGCAQAGDRVRAHWVLQHHWRRMWT